MILTHLFLLRLQSFLAQIPRELLAGECKGYLEFEKSNK